MTIFRFRLASIVWLGLFLACGVFAQQLPPQRNSYGPLSQGGTAQIPNTAGSQAVSFEYIFSATPASVSITIQGCMRGKDGTPGQVGTCDTAVDTYTTTSNSVRSPSFTKVYDTFLITVGTLSGATVTINTTVVVSKVGTSSGGGGGSGTVTNTGGALANNFVMLGAGGNDSKTDTALSTNGAGSMTDTTGGTALTHTQGTITTSNPTFSHTATWNAGAVAFTDWLSNITCTAAATNSIAAGWGTAGTQWQFKYGAANCASPQFLIPAAASVAVPSIATSAVPSGGFGIIGNAPFMGRASFAFLALNTASTVEIGNGVAICYSSSGDAITSGCDTGMSRQAANLTAIGNGAQGDETGLLRWNECRVTADITLPVNTATTVCTWSLPAVAKAWAWQCNLQWAITVGTGTNTIAIVANPSQTPTGTTNGSGVINPTTSTLTAGSAPISASGGTTLVTSATVTPGATVLTATSGGTLLASGTAGTFAIQMTAAGTTATAAAKAGSTCQLY